MIHLRSLRRDKNGMRVILVRYKPGRQFAPKLSSRRDRRVKRFADIGDSIKLSIKSCIHNSVAKKYASWFNENLNTSIKIRSILRFDGNLDREYRFETTAGLFIK